ncbi:hypothetical protein EC515_04265 [Helicobacter pylori]|nr:hypothetical protein EC515_04265 [Helicobacter pylori]
MKNPVSLLRSFLRSFLFKALALSIFESLECFLKSFHLLRACLSVTLLARFNKNRLIFLVTLR